MLLVMLLLPMVTARNTYVSSPFDNFRMECPKRAAAVDMSVRMVESVGAKREDIVFDMSCEAVEELFPWVNIPTGISEIEREDCYYSAMFDPILDETTTFTCKRREYLAGIARLTDTRLQVLCCRLRSRDEFNCQETIFNKPIGLSKSTIIEHENQLINAIRIEDKAYVVRFCDLAPRNIADIYGDTKRTTPRRRVTTVRPPMKTEKRPYMPFIGSSTTTTLRPAVSSVPTTSAQSLSPPLSSLRPSDRTDTSTTTTLTTTPNLDQKSTTPTESASKETVVTITHETITVTEPFISSTLASTTSETSVPDLDENEPETSIPVAKVMESMTENVDSDEVVETTPSDFPQRIEEAIRGIHKASSKSAERLFKETIQNLLNEQKSTDTVPSNNVDALSRITFPNEDFPRSSEKKFAIPAKTKISKTDLPLKDGSADDFIFLHTINSEGHRRAPIRTHRPHVENGSSGETDGGFWQEATVETPRPRKVKKIRRKLTRADRLRLAEIDNRVALQFDADIGQPAQHVMRVSSSSQEASTSTYSEPQTEEADGFTMTTTSASRRDLPSSRKTAPTVSHQMDNAHSIDEETNLSPFEDENPLSLGKPRHSVGSSVNAVKTLELKGNEDIEEVIIKLSADTKNIRRAPMRKSMPGEQKLEKYADDNKSTPKESIMMMKRKDGNKTVTPKGFQPIFMPEMTIFENQHSEDSIVEETTKTGQDMDTEAEHSSEEKSNKSSEQEELFDNLILASSRTFIGDRVTTPVEESSTSHSHETVGHMVTVGSRTTPTTEYDPSLFYRTPDPVPPKKEKILTFCTKDVALRDHRNMVIACGGEQDIWYPARCPQGADCFLSGDSTYRLCCLVSSG